MAKLPQETTQTILSLKMQLLDLVEAATATEWGLFERFGETKETVPFLDEMKSVAEQAKSRFEQMSNLQIRIAQAQPLAPVAMLELLSQAIGQNQQRIPAWKRSIEEVQLEWNLL